MAKKKKKDMFLLTDDDGIMITEDEGYSTASVALCKNEEELDYLAQEWFDEDPGTSLFVYKLVPVRVYKGKPSDEIPWEDV